MAKEQSGRVVAAKPTMEISTSGQPDLSTIRTVDDVAGYLRQLRAWAGLVSYPELTRRINRTRDPRAHARQTTVYDCFRPGRKRLDPDLVLEIAAALGLDEPGRSRLRQAIASAHRAAAGAPRSAGVPRQLPGSPQMFTGRGSELAALDRNPDPATVLITVIDGMAGIGKTALAVHAAHRLADRYPDGQLFIDLHGYTHGVPPVESSAALDRLLRSLGVAGEHLPAGLDERAALYRSRLAGRRLLILLDNAATEDQVAPLLPGTPGCLVLVTSRRRLAGLDPAHTLSLDTLPPADAVALFTQAVGADRLRATRPELLTESVELCGRVPLAIRIAAARLRAHPTWPVSQLVERLRDHRHRLAELAAGPRSVTAALDLSYQQLTGEQPSAYRRFGLHPGPDLEPYAAAVLLAIAPELARRLLDQLVEAQLLTEPRPGRYEFHDLIRAHATITAEAVDPESDRRAALTRLLDYYRHATSAAMDAAYPHERERRPQVPPARTPTPELPDRSAGLSWLDVELPNLLAAAQHCAQGWPEHAWQLTAVPAPHLRTRGRYRDAEALHRQALTAARAAGDRTGELITLVCLGRVHLRQSRHKDALDQFRQALRLARATGNRTGELDALHGAGDAHLLQARYDQALVHYRQSLGIARRTGSRTGEVEALHGLGWIYLLQARYDQALVHYRQSLGIARRSGNHTGELNALTGIGWISLLQGQYRQATAYCGQALDVARATGHRTGELNALRGLGDAYRLQGDHEHALEVYHRALEIASAIGDRAGELGALSGLGWTYFLRGHHEQAAELFQQTLCLARAVSNRHGQFEAQHGLGRVQHAANHPDAALVHHRAALGLAIDLGQPADEARAHDGLAHAHHAMQQSEPARQHWQRALDLLTSLGTDYTEEEAASVPAIRSHLAELGPLRQPDTWSGPVRPDRS